MANICILTDAVTHNAATSCRNALTWGGHSVTLVADTNVSAQDYTTFDVVVTSRTSAANRSPIAAKLNALNNAGKPLVIGLMESGGATTGEQNPTIASVMGITGLATVNGIEGNLNILNVEHPIISGIAKGVQTVFSVNNYVLGVTVGEPYLGTALANGNTGTLAGLPAIIAMETGTARLNAGAPLGAPIGIFPTYLITGEYTELHRTLLLQAVGWATGVAYVEPAVLRSSKLVAYAVMDVPAGNALSSKLVAYAVMDVEHAQVYSSKLMGYAVMVPVIVLPKVGNVLGRQGHEWTGNPTEFEDRWQRGGIDIPGATSAEYALIEADQGAMVRNLLRAKNANGWSIWIESAPVGPIDPE